MSQAMNHAPNQALNQVITTWASVSSDDLKKSCDYCGGEVVEPVLQLAGRRETYWRPINEAAPYRRRVLLLGLGGIVQISELRSPQHFWTHWAPLPVMPEDSSK